MQTLPRVKVVKKYSDIVIGEIKEVGEIFEVDEQRAEHLEKEGAVKILREPKAKAGKEE